MILYGVTVYNAILIISYRIITYKLIYITVTEEHPGHGLAPGPRLHSWSWPSCGWGGPSFSPGELQGGASGRGGPLYTMETPVAPMQEGRAGLSEGRMRKTEGDRA